MEIFEVVDIKSFYVCGEAGLPILLRIRGRLGGLIQWCTYPRSKYGELMLNPMPECAYTIAGRVHFILALLYFIRIEIVTEAFLRHGMHCLTIIPPHPNEGDRKCHTRHANQQGDENGPGPGKRNCLMAWFAIDLKYLHSKKRLAMVQC